MIDLREKIIELAEECLHSFIEERLQTLGLNDNWKKNLPFFVEEQQAQFPQNVESLRIFLNSHPVNEICISTLDITATITLLLFYNDLKPLYQGCFEKKISNTYISCFYDFQNLRNYIKHYTVKISEQQRETFIMDQFEAICCIIRFSLICIKNCNREEYWKGNLSQALYFQGIIRKEKWFLLESEKNKDFSPDDDYSDIEISAENGNVSAQVYLGKILYGGSRYGTDIDKAFMWFFKAARQNNMEAMYYLALCYQRGIGVDYDFEKSIQWFKKSANMGYAPSQYKVAEYLYPKNDVTDQESKYMIELLNKSAEQEYPPAMFLLGQCYEMGYRIKTDLEKSVALEEASAELGYVLAAEQLAEKAVRKKDYEVAKKWYEVAKKHDSKKAKSALERFEKRGHF